MIGVPRVSTRRLLRSGHLTRCKLTAAQSLTLIVLVDHVDEDGICFPSQETMALESGLSRMGLRKALLGLIEKGLLEIVAPGGPRRSARYRVVLPTDLRATG